MLEFINNQIKNTDIYFYLLYSVCITVIILYGKYRFIYIDKHTDIL